MSTLWWHQSNGGTSRHKFCTFASLTSLTWYVSYDSPLKRCLKDTFLIHLYSNNSQVFASWKNLRWNLNKLKLVATASASHRSQTRYKRAQAKNLRWLAFSFDKGLNMSNPMDYRFNFEPLLQVTSKSLYTETTFTQNYLSNYPWFVSKTKPKLVIRYTVTVLVAIKILIIIISFI